mgnify:CR=1 FL=1
MLFFFVAELGGGLGFEAAREEEGHFYYYTNKEDRELVSIQVIDEKECKEYFSFAVGYDNK